MIIFNNYNIIKGHNFIKLSADSLIQFEHFGYEDYSIGTPKCWDDDILSKIDIGLYNIYFVCTKVIPNGIHNRITNHKKIWGLNNIGPGIYDNMYDCGSGRVYFGIVEAHGEDGFRSNTSSILVLIPKMQFVPPEQLFSYFKCRKFNCSDGDYRNFFSKMQELIANSIIFHYRMFSEISLSIYGNSIETIFNKNFINKWEKTQTSPVFRKGL